MDFWELVALIFCGRGGGQSPRCDQVVSFPWGAVQNNMMSWPVEAGNALSFGDDTTFGG